MELKEEPKSGRKRDTRDRRTYGQEYRARPGVAGHRREYMAKWRDEHAEELALQRRTSAHREAGRVATKKFNSTPKGRAYRLAYKESNAEKIQEQGAEYRAAHHDEIIQSSAEYRSMNKDKARAGNRRRKFGITSEEYQQLFDSQHGLCAICETSNPGAGHPTFSVDHDHKTGRVRALLCNHCNSHILPALESPLRAKADAYLKRFEEGHYPNVGASLVKMPNGYFVMPGNERMSKRTQARWGRGGDLRSGQSAPEVTDA